MMRAHSKDLAVTKDSHEFREVHPHIAVKKEPRQLATDASSACLAESELAGSFLGSPMKQDELEVIDSIELAKRLSVPESWIRSRANQKRTSDPIPHYRLGRYIRFSWGSVELSDWLSRQLVSTDRVWSRREL